MNPGTPVTLRAYAASNLSQQLFSILGGTWTHATNSNANLVPTVAKGRVYVASNMQLRIYGLTGHDNGVVNDPIVPSKPETVSCPGGHRCRLRRLGVQRPYISCTGPCCEASGAELKLTVRSSRAVSIDTSTVANQHHPVLLTPGRSLHVSVTIDKAGVAHAQRIAPAHTMSSHAGGPVASLALPRTSSRPHGVFTLSGFGHRRFDRRCLETTAQFTLRPIFAKTPNGLQALSR